ncbi:hypothetical protein [Leptospira ellisii]|uniref:hypothetical protein n=1 Tax=Leptospira ellisii TaxID=2023197 RepID=UPI000C29AE56|nr:hypothetical protein [Leptospira ellisii]PKA03308.1 hypothetical protein CH375_17765 [Leptospira ellisii]
MKIVWELTPSSRERTIRLKYSENQRSPLNQVSLPTSLAATKAIFLKNVQFLLQKNRAGVSSHTISF